MTWTAQTPKNPSSGFDVVYANGIFVAAGFKDVVLISRDWSHPIDPFGLM
jgi:hypothetical protein